MKRLSIMVPLPLRAHLTQAQLAQARLAQAQLTQAQSTWPSLSSAIVQFEGIPMHSPSPTYQNVIESLVAHEVDRQLSHLSPNLVAYIQSTEVMAYALNRLPPLYATSLEGWERQRYHAETELLEQIVIAVRQGIAAVQRDPIKISTPLEKAPRVSRRANF